MHFVASLRSKTNNRNKTFYPTFRKVEKLVKSRINQGCHHSNNVKQYLH